MSAAALLALIPPPPPRLFHPRRPDPARVPPRVAHRNALIHSTPRLSSLPRASTSGLDDLGDGREAGTPPWWSPDAFLPIAEIVCVAPAVVLAVGGMIGCLLPKGSPGPVRIYSGNPWLAGQLFLLAGAIVVGGMIRERQWRRICRDNGVPGCDLVQRIEKMEDDVRSSATIVRVLSRQLEKLGIRFRVTRKSLKDPISEAAVLAQKNSEATRALALQADILEKELKEIQMVLLAMQEQQQKQLDLILAVVKAGRLFESKGEKTFGQDTSGNTNLVPQNEEREQIEARIGNNKV